MVNARKKYIIKNLAKAIDITIYDSIDGNIAPSSNPKPYILVLNDEFYDRVINDTDLGLGESYIHGMWRTNDLKGLFIQILSRYDELKKHLSSSIGEVLFSFLYLFVNRQRLKPFEVGEKHYDYGNEFYEKLLDKRKTYSCAYWYDSTKNIDEAQENKLELLCKKAELKAGETVLDIGCGWGSFIGYAKENYNVNCTGLTVSVEQEKYINDEYGIKTFVQDYNDHTGKYDKIISVGMFEHVGHKNYKSFFEKVNSLLNENGIFVLHTIGRNKFAKTDRFIDKYIFPNGHVPDLESIANAYQEIFILEDFHNLGRNYEKTMDAWIQNFQNKIVPNMTDLKEKRIWEYYLNGFSASFSCRHLQLWQFVFTRTEDRREQPKRFS